jgi:glycosyltransferase involved in cell wall biosynthesis
LDVQIIHFIHRFWPSRGGSENYLLNLAETLVERGHETTVVTTDADSLQALWNPGQARHLERLAEYRGIRIRRFPIRYFPLHRIARKLLQFAPGVSPGLRNPDSPWVPALERFAVDTTERFDLVHCTALPYDGVLFPALTLSKRLGAPLVCTPFVHLGEPENDRVRRHYSRPQQIELLRQCSAAIVQTELEREFLISAGLEAPPIHLIPQGLDPRDVEGGSAERIRKELDCPGPMIAHIAPLCRDKGSIDLIQAFALLNASEKTRLVLVGEPHEEFLKALMDLPPATRNRIVFLRNISDEWRNDLLAAMDMLVLPSRTDSFGRVFLEAWQYGKPVIGARAGGIPGVIQHEQNGLLVPFGNPKALAESLARLLSSPELCVRLRAKGKAELPAKYDQITNLGRIVELFARLARQ